MSWTVQLHGHENLGPEMRATFHEGLVLGMEKLGIEGQRMVQQNIATPYNGLPPAVFSGNLLEAVQSQVTDEQAMIRLNVGVGTSAGADRYAPAVETGARPHFPPIQALVLWVKKKFGTEDEKSAISAAWAVAKTIAKRGTRGHMMFARGLEQLEPIAAPTLEKAIAQAFIRSGYAGGAE
jgi:hypothetical protein